MDAIYLQYRYSSRRVVNLSAECAVHSCAMCRRNVILCDADGCMPGFVADRLGKVCIGKPLLYQMCCKLNNFLDTLLVEVLSWTVSNMNLAI